MRTVYPVGTTLYKPDRCWNGYTLIWHGRVVKLIDMNGRTVNEWRAETAKGDDRVHRARLLENGNVLVGRGGMMSESGRVQEYDWDGALAWEYVPEGAIPHREYLGPHHDVFRKRNGNTLVICRQAVPADHMKQVREPTWQGRTLYGDTILEVDRDCEVVWEWHSHGHLDLNRYRIIASDDWFAGPHNNTLCDWTHVNTVRALPENRWHDAGDSRFRPGNVMISPRCLDAVYIIDRETKDVVWEYEGDFRGGLSGQHEPHMIRRGLPGEGNVLIFDNGATPWKDLAHAGRSFVLEVDPVTKEVVWFYEAGAQFHATYTSSAERLANGNTLICESAGKRVFEVTPEREIVWEHVEGTGRSYRYAYDHCPQTAALGRPKEAPVTPPEDFRIPPDQPL